MTRTGTPVLVLLIALLPAQVTLANIVETIREHLERREWRKAASTAAKVAGQQADSLVGAAAAESLAETLTLRAIALEETGETAEAVWYWHLALIIEAEVAARTLGTPPPERSGSFAVARRTAHDHNGVKACEVPPTPRSPPDIIYPAAAKAQMNGRRSVLASAVISKQGSPTQPFLMHSNADAPWIFFAFESAKRVRFRPGQSAGGPTECPFIFNFRFDPQ